MRNRRFVCLPLRQADACHLPLAGEDRINARPIRASFEPGLAQHIGAGGVMIELCISAYIIGRLIEESVCGI